MFPPYLKTLECSPILGDVAHGGHELFDKIKGVFFEEFLGSYSNHIESVWTSGSILAYIMVEIPG